MNEEKVLKSEFKVGDMVWLVSHEWKLLLWDFDFGIRDMPIVTRDQIISITDSEDEFESELYFFFKNEKCSMFEERIFKNLKDAESFLNASHDRMEKRCRTFQMQALDMQEQYLKRLSASGVEKPSKEQLILGYEMHQMQLKRVLDLRAMQIAMLKQVEELEKNEE